MARPARVLILHDYAGARGGAEVIALDFRRLLEARGIETRLMTSNADPWDEASAPDAVCNGGHDRLRPFREAWNPSAASVLMRTIAEFRPDVVQIVMFLSQLSPAVLPILANVPTVYAINTYRIICPTGLRWRPGEGVCTLAAGRACGAAGCISTLGLPFRRLQLSFIHRWRGAIDRFVAPSQVMADLLACHGFPSTDVVPHSVPRHLRIGGTADVPTAAFSGRLVPEKGTVWLLESFALALKQVPEARLLMLGGGPDLGRLKSLAQMLGIAGQVVFTGHLPRAESQRLLETAWVQVVPSLWAEPFGLVAAEALMRQTPVIASDAGGPREIVDHGVTGWVVPTGDHGALSGALTAALSDRKGSAALGRAGMKIAQRRYDEDKWIDAYLAIYSEFPDRRPEVWA